MNIKNKKIITKTLIFLLSSSFFCNTTLAESLDVTANIPSGTYNSVIKVELTPTDSNAKTFYSFNPNGGPNDAFLYKGAITITKSTPLIFFSYTSTSNETKIKQNDYILQFPNDIRLNSGASFENGNISNLSLTNIGTDAIDISLWDVRNDSGKVIVPDETKINPQENFSINGLSGTGTVSLFAPNEEKKDFVEIIDKTVVIPLQGNKTDPIKEIPKVKTTTEPIPTNTGETTPTTTGMKPETNTNTGATILESGINTPPSNNETISAPAESATNENNGNKLNDAIKVSINENGNNTGSNSGKYMIFGILGLAIGGGLGFKFYKYLPKNFFKTRIGR